MFGVKQTITFYRTFKNEEIVEKEKENLKLVDECIEEFFDTTRNYWKRNLGEIHKLTTVNW